MIERVNRCSFETFSLSLSLSLPLVFNVFEDRERRDCVILFRAQHSFVSERRRSKSAEPLTVERSGERRWINKFLSDSWKENKRRARLWITLKRFSKKKKKRKKKSSRRDRCCFLSRLEFRIERNPGSFQTWPSNEERFALPRLVAKSVVL